MNKAQLIAAAEQAGWPRVWTERASVRPDDENKIDWIGPGCHVWTIGVSQMSAERVQAFGDALAGRRFSPPTGWGELLRPAARRHFEDALNKGENENGSDRPDEPSESGESAESRQPIESGESV